MPRRQILSSEEQERLLVIPDDEIILTRMCFLNEPDIALINKGVSLEIGNFCTLSALFNQSWFVRG